MGKNGDAGEFWVILTGALTVLGLILIFPFFGKTKALAEDLTDYHICRDGNIGVVKTRVQLFDWVIAEQGVRYCKTEKIKVTSGKEYETIAKKMSLCWNEYLEGKEELFDTKSANYCAFCSVLEFDDKNKKLNELSKYLDNNKELSSGKTYMGCLQN